MRLRPPRVYLIRTFSMRWTTFVRRFRFLYRVSGTNLVKKKYRAKVLVTTCSALRNTMEPIYCQFLPQRMIFTLAKDSPECQLLRTMYFIHYAQRHIAAVIGRSFDIEIAVANRFSFSFLLCCCLVSK